jgi:glycerophosphoryl diester phosphodiesterase
MWNDLPIPVIVAHRGDKSCAPENTLSAFKLAVEKRADAVEFDVKLTADGQVIVLHDQTVDRTTSGSGNVAKLPLSALQELDAGVQFPGQFPGERIPSLEEVFETVGRQIYMNVELTNYSTPCDALVLKVVDLVKKHRLQNRILFSSFVPWNLQKARLLLPEVPRGLLTLPGLKGTWGRTIGWRGNYSALHPHLMDVNFTLVSRIHSAGKLVNIWTVVIEADLKRMIGLGVDGIITADLSLALRLIKRGK